MPWKSVTLRLRNSFLFTAAYRIPQPVTQVLLFDSGNSYPICPRCGETIDREYVHFCDRCGQRLSWEHFDMATVVRVPRR